jgi:hypothetical protein
MVYLTISGDQVVRIVQDKPWRLVIELRDGSRVVVEPDFYEEIRRCDPKRDDDSCYLENLYLRIRTERW